MTRDEFFTDVKTALRLLARLGIPELQAETEERIASMKAGGLGVTPDDLRRYSDAIDWVRSNIPLCGAPHKGIYISEFMRSA